MAQDLIELPSFELGWRRFDRQSDTDTNPKFKYTTLFIASIHIRLLRKCLALLAVMCDRRDCAQMQVTIFDARQKPHCLLSYSISDLTTQKCHSVYSSRRPSTGDETKKSILFKITLTTLARRRWFIDTAESALRHKWTTAVEQSDMSRPSAAPGRSDPGVVLRDGNPRTPCQTGWVSTGSRMRLFL